MFRPERLSEIIERTVASVHKLDKVKGGEYAPSQDRLENFRHNASMLDLPMETIWAIYAGKHWDAIRNYCKDVQQGVKRTRSEAIEGRLDDLIVYCILMKAIIEDQSGQWTDKSGLVQQTGTGDLIAAGTGTVSEPMRSHKAQTYWEPNNVDICINCGHGRASHVIEYEGSRPCPK